MSIAGFPRPVHRFSPRPKKCLGQHFLKNTSVAEIIVNALNPHPGDFFVEIGPGRGELTLPLLSRAGSGGFSYRGVEKDARLADELEKRLLKSTYGDVSIIRGDIRDMSLSDLSGGTGKNLKLFGNIPYYLSGNLFRMLTDSSVKPTLAVFTVQKEVAERAVAVKGRMNRLAALVGFWYGAEIIAHMGRKDFFPSPKVDSAVIRLILREDAEKSGRYWDTYVALVKNAFAQPRKTLLNNLIGPSNKRLDGKKSAEALLESMELPKTSRPHDLTLENLIKMSEMVYNKHNERQKK